MAEEREPDCLWYRSRLKPVTLGAVGGVGQDASGVLYMDSTTGVFVSESGTLFRSRLPAQVSQERTSTYSR